MNRVRLYPKLDNPSGIIDPFQESETVTEATLTARHYHAFDHLLVGNVDAEDRHPVVQDTNGPPMNSAAMASSSNAVLLARLSRAAKTIPASAASTPMFTNNPEGD